MHFCKCVYIKNEIKDIKTSLGKTIEVLRRDRYLRTTKMVIHAIRIAYSVS